MGVKDKDHRMSRWGRTTAAVVVVSVMMLAAALVVAGCESDSTEALVTGASSGSINWTGNGSGNNCEYGGSLHWILTTGGNVTLLTGTLHVSFSDGSSGNYTGYFQGGNQGAMHFDSTGAASVTSASADFTYTGTLGNQVLTISHSTCNTTTTDGEETTTTVGEETTTTTGRETSTTVGDVTSTTVGNVTSTTAGNVTSTTAGRGTSTTVGNVTSSTARQETSTTVGDVTSSSVMGATSTAGRIDTGGGGTTGPNIMLWLIVTVLGGLAVALGGSAVWSLVKEKGAGRSR